VPRDTAGVPADATNDEWHPQRIEACLSGLRRREQGDVESEIAFGLPQRSCGSAVTVATGAGSGEAAE